ncbi:hypothetical protein GWI33_001294 [Rhynchophorus ferrugineus]|uniref:Uncharacterized protein n=1 Tax=Rhynchophorus ferrugineus TaxID=354439 RepID=A0A834HM04_RHYFE|nr:hypothetical protein GWI33_001294 [Rhynchophorus ferrugineus]
MTGKSATFHRGHGGNTAQERRRKARKGKIKLHFFHFNFFISEKFRIVFQFRTPFIFTLSEPWRRRRGLRPWGGPFSDRPLNAILPGIVFGLVLFVFTGFKRDGRTGDG